MKSFRFVQGAAVVVAWSLAGTAQAQDEGVKQVERLVKKSRAAVESIANTKTQLLKTMDVYNGLIADTATDRKDAYKKLQKEMTSTDERRAEIGVRSGEADAEAEILFKSWADSAAAIANADLRKRSEDRLAAAKASQARIKAAGQKAAELYGPVMKALQDQVTYLGHDLNATAVASLKPDAAKLGTQVQELVKRIDETISTADTAIAALGPQ